MVLERISCPNCGHEYKIVRGSVHKDYYCIECMSSFKISDNEDLNRDYGEIAVRAVEIIEDGIVSNPKDAWDKAFKEMYDGDRIDEYCLISRTAFLGLCEEGKVTCVDSDRYTKSRIIKKDALDILHFIEKHPAMTNQPKGIWAVVRPWRKNKGQLNVVLGLWNNGLIRS